MLAQHHSQTTPNCGKYQSAARSRGTGRGPPTMNNTNITTATSSTQRKARRWWAGAGRSVVSGNRACQSGKFNLTSVLISVVSAA